MLWKLENAGEDQQSPPRGRITTTGGSPSNCARPPAEREDAGTRSQNHCSGNIPYPIRCFLRNKKRKIPGNKVTFISALESTPAGWPQGWHFQWALKRGILPWDWYKRKQISKGSIFSANSSAHMSPLRLSAPSLLPDWLSHLPLYLVQEPQGSQALSHGLQVGRLLPGETGSNSLPGSSHWPRGSSWEYPSVPDL